MKSLKFIVLIFLFLSLHQKTYAQCCLPGDETTCLNKCCKPGVPNGNSTIGVMGDYFHPKGHARGFKINTNNSLTTGIKYTM